MNFACFEFSERSYTVCMTQSSRFFHAERGSQKIIRSTQEVSITNLDSRSAPEINYAPALSVHDSAVQK